MVTFPSIEMYFNSNSNLVEFLFSPAQISEESDIHSKEIAISAVKALKSAGLFAVELFLFKDGVIWINEIAPRPHNSGHHTIEGCFTSQFLQLNNILLDRKLGDTSLIKPSAMINIVGPEDFEGTYNYAHIDWLNSQKGCFLHDYGKTLSKANRKLGHITVMSENMVELIQKCETVKGYISVKPS
jgi:5-(carboxyamino)imidazole ribonucleotide synthase